MIWLVPRMRVGQEVNKDLVGTKEESGSGGYQRFGSYQVREWVRRLTKIW